MLNKLYSSFRRETSNQLYFPEIDGIRFLAITIVVLFHTYGYLQQRYTGVFTQPQQYELLNKFLVNGERGVQLFFVLSGFILCLPFAHHYINQGRKPELKKYYLRRLTRLEPPYIVAMLLLFCGVLVMKIQAFSFIFPSLLASLIYSHGLIYHTMPYLMVVAWSLEVEIQFYIIAPLLFRLLALPKVLRRSLLIAAALAFVLLQWQYPAGFQSIYMQAQYFLTGILLADLYVSDFAGSELNKLWVLPAAFLALTGICYLPIQQSLWAALLFPFLVAFFFFAILKNDRIKKVFSYKLIPIIGGMCYSIYLLHYTIISVAGRLLVRMQFSSYYLLNLLCLLLLTYLVVLLLSAVYYYYVERPFMSKKWIEMLSRGRKKHVPESAQDAQAET